MELNNKIRKPIVCVCGAVCVCDVGEMHGRVIYTHTPIAKHTVRSVGRRSFQFRRVWRSFPFIRMGHRRAKAIVSAPLIPQVQWNVSSSTTRAGLWLHRLETAVGSHVGTHIQIEIHASPGIMTNKCKIRKSNQKPVIKQNNNSNRTKI